jgi:phosphomannomutase
MKKLIVFDLDGTIAESKSAIDAEMSALLRGLLRIVKVAVISGGNWPQFERQLVSNLPQDANFKNLSLLPTCGTKFYKYDSTWEKLYSEDFTGEERASIFAALEKAIDLSDVSAKRFGGSGLKIAVVRLRSPQWAKRLRWKKRRSGTRIFPSGSG